MPRTTSALKAALAGSAVLLTLWTCADPLGPPERAAPPRSSQAAVVSRVMLAAGDIADCTRDGDEATATLIEGILAGDSTAIVQTLGDNAYEDGTAEDYADCYDPSWGRFLGRTRPQIGNHEYNVSVAPTFDYFGDAAFNGNRPGGYYSYNLGDWHIIVLNDNNSNVKIVAGSPQEQWLRADLASNTKQCTMAIWHGPRFYSTMTAPAGVRATPYAAWVALYEARVDVVLNAHNHLYERHAPQDPDGNPTPDGIRQFIVGTGGAKTQGTPTGGISANSEVRHGGFDQYGIIKMTLSTGGYSWEFLPIPGVTFTDSGSATCHGQLPNTAPTARPGGPYTGVEGVPTELDGSASTDPENHPLTYAWTFGDGTTGTGASPTHLYPDQGSYTASLVVTDSKGLSSAPQTTTVAIAAAPPSVEAGSAAALSPGQSFALSATFGDGATDGPWNYTIQWGDQSTTSGTRSSANNPITASHTYTGDRLNVVRVTVTAADGSAGTDSTFVTVGGTTLVGAGTIARCDKTFDEATATELDGIPGTVFTLGDHVLEGTATEFADCYQPSWGRHRSRTRPVPGDKEYLVSGATPYYSYFGTAAGDPAKGYYSYNLGDWHVIVLNSSLSTSASSSQVQWLRADLQANPKTCTMALWHYPLFSSGASGPRTSMKPLWDALYQFGADVVLNGHYAIYERFAPQTPAGVADPVNGIRAFTVGTGGQNSNSLVTTADNSEIRMKGVYGVLRLILMPNGYTWSYEQAAGVALSDSGSTVCH
jgi:PKD repeat protein